MGQGMKKSRWKYFDISEIRRYIKISKSSKIARRYFIMNCFDGTLTMLGILFGAYLAGSENVTVIVSAGVGAAIALGVSGATSAYMTEDAERSKEIKRLESAMLIKLDNTIYEIANRFAKFYLAAVNGISPVITSVVILSPFLTSSLNSFDIWEMYHISFAVIGLLFFLLGIYIGRIGGKSIWKKGLQMLFIGFITSFLIYLTSVVQG
jgi:predicted membrane protein (TIGR00267 family)